MKKTRLLEIIKEEINSAINEIPDFGGKLDTGVSQKYGEEDTLQSVVDAIVDETLKDEGVTKEDLKKDAEKAKEVITIMRKKIVGKNADSRVKDALEKQEDIEIDTLGGPSGKDLQSNQTNNALKKALGLTTPKPRGRKASPKTSEPTTSSEPKSTKVDSDDEAPSGDSEVEKAARGRDELVKQYRRVMDTYKEKKSTEGDKEALEYLKTKQDIVKKYKKAQKVEA